MTTDSEKFDPDYLDPEYGYSLASEKLENLPFIDGRNGYIPGLSREIRVVSGSVIHAAVLSLGDAERMTRRIDFYDLEQNGHLYDWEESASCYTFGELLTALEDESLPKYSPQLLQYSYIDRNMRIPPEAGYLLLVNHAGARDLSSALQVTSEIVRRKIEIRAMRRDEPFDDHDKRKLGLLYYLDAFTGRILVLIGIIDEHEKGEDGYIFALIDNKSLPHGLQSDFYSVLRKDKEE